MRDIQLSITITALILVVLHIAFPSLRIDGVLLTLLLVAVLPWVIPLLKSLELPGGWKLEFQDFQRVKNEADKVGLLVTEDIEDEAPKYSFEIIANQDPNLALAGLRIEIEKRLNEIAVSHDIDIRKASVGRLLQVLKQEQILTQQESAVLADMIGLLNSAVHGAQVDKSSADWAIEVGVKLLKGLDEKIQKN